MPEAPAVVAANTLTAGASHQPGFAVPNEGAREAISLAQQQARLFGHLTGLSPTGRDAKHVCQLLSRPEVDVAAYADKLIADNHGIG